MNELYLVVHKVYGQPAFDVAVKMDCPLCADHDHDLDGYCHECDCLGYWWIIPTSGHRAYPVAEWEVSDLRYGNEECSIPISMPVIPDDLPDHYIAQAAKPRSLTDILNLRKAPTEPRAPFPRRL